MNIVIVGDGKVGFTLAEFLAQENHDVTLVDRDAEALEKASNTLDVMTVEGNGANAATLIEAGVNEADILVAVTTNDEINMVCCLMGKQLGAQYTIARIRDPEYTDSLHLLTKGLGIDMVVNPERATALLISRLLRFPFALHVETFAHGRVEMVEFKVEASDGITGVNLSSIHKKFPKVLYCAVDRGGKSIIPGGDFVIQSGDRVFVTGDVPSITQFFKQIGRDFSRLRNVMLIGGGNISYYLAKSIEPMGMDIRIIEVDKARCEWLSEHLDDAVIIHGDGTEQELLNSEDIGNMNALVCLTGRDEENLLTGLYGVKIGVKKVIVKVNRHNYMDVIGDVGIDNVVSPKRTTAGNILRAVRAMKQSEKSAAVEKLYPILGGEVEALEFTAKKGARYLGTPIKALSIRSGALIAVLVRDRKIIIPFGNDHIESGDTVIVVAKAREVAELDDVIDVM